MKEFIWKVCCLIWHFDDRAIKEHKKREFEALKKLEKLYWIKHQEYNKKFDELETRNIDINEENFVPYHYGVILGKADAYACLWNALYDRVFTLGNELGKDDELNELRKQRQQV